MSVINLEARMHDAQVGQDGAEAVRAREREARHNAACLQEQLHNLVVQCCAREEALARSGGNGQ